MIHIGTDLNIAKKTLNVSLVGEAVFAFSVEEFCESLYVAAEFISAFSFLFVDESEGFYISAGLGRVLFSF